MINTPDILDIYPDRSFIKALLSLGLTVYLMEWHADPIKNRYRPMADYIINDLDQAMMQVCADESVPKCHVMGVCQGGYFSLCLNALKPERFASIIPVVTPIDFHAPGCKLYSPSHSQYVESFLSGLKQAPFISGKVVGTAINMIDPLYILQNKTEAWQTCSDSIDKQVLFYNIEKWSQDYPDHPTQVIVDFFEQAIAKNTLINQRLMLNNQYVNIENIKNPILNVYATKDYFWSEQTPAALAHHHRSQQYEDYVYDGGHIGVFVSEKALNTIPARIADFIQTISHGAMSSYAKVV